MPYKKSNLCIAGHNYNDDRFFSRISELNLNDAIFLEDNYNNIFKYSVYDKFEIEESEISRVTDYTKYDYELTLVTCNNFNNNRIVVKAKAVKTDQV